jgi:hypothetical protein
MVTLLGFLKKIEVMVFGYTACQKEIYKWRLVGHWVNQLWTVQEQTMNMERSGWLRYMVGRLTGQRWR